jgi:tetratricopeptide (TPR) repeat protein
MRCTTSAYSGNQAHSGRGVRPVAGRRVRLVALVVCLAALAPAWARAQGDRREHLSRIDRVERWAEAVERHQPGASDAALQVLDSWVANDLAELKTEVNSVVALMRDPSIRIFYRPGARGRTASQVLYSLQELRRLVAVAARLAPLGDNLVLKRAAMLHTDAALGARADATDSRRRTDLFVFQFSDGQELGQVDSIGHWDMARFLLDMVKPDKNALRPEPGRDDWVRRWYGTAIAYQLARMNFAIGTTNRGLELFRDDAELLYLAGVMHEALASTAVQEAFRGTDFYLRSSLGLSSRRGELNTAEGLFGRALKLNPSLAQVRLHLGHVLAEQGEHKKALAELTQALTAIRNPDLLYYGQLFSGRSAAALGQTAAARTAFEQAARLKPNAQSPLLALSQLAYAQGDTGEAAAMLARVADLPALDGDDPWWVYNASVGLFFFEPLRQNIVETLRAEMPK